MQENKNSNSIDDERKLSIKYSMGCLLIIVVTVFGIAISLIFMYLKSILGGSKEFFIH